MAAHTRSAAARHLRMGVGSYAATPAAGVQGEGTRADAGARSNRTLSPDSLTSPVHNIYRFSSLAIEGTSSVALDGAVKYARPSTECRADTLLPARGGAA